MILDQKYYQNRSFLLLFFSFLSEALRLLSNPSNFLRKKTTSRDPLMILFAISSEAKIACDSCGACQEVCPVNCIEIKGTQPEKPEIFTIDLFKCIQCHYCIDVCPHTALTTKKMPEIKSLPNAPWNLITRS